MTDDQKRAAHEQLADEYEREGTDQFVASPAEIEDDDFPGARE